MKCFHSRINFIEGKMSNNILIFVLVMFFLIGSFSIVSASPLATIASSGLSFIDPGIGNVVNTLICLQNPVSCAVGKVTGIIQNSVIQAVVKATGPEVGQAFEIFNQMKGLVDNGNALIKNDFKIDSVNINGEDVAKIVSGEADFTKNSDISKFFNLEDGSLSASNLNLKFEKGIANVNFNQDNGILKVKDSFGLREFKNIKKSGNGINSFMKLDENGEILIVLLKV